MGTLWLSKLPVLSLACLLGCADMPSFSKQQIGTVAGAGLGAAAGSQIGKGSGRTAAMVGMGAAGAYIGNRIGKGLDDRDRQRLANATMQTAQTGQPQVMVSPDSGARIRTAVVSAEPAAPGTGARANDPVKPTTSASSGGSTADATSPRRPRPAKTTSAKTAPVASAEPECRTVRQSVDLQDGSTQTDDVRLCKGANGWEPV